MTGMLSRLLALGIAIFSLAGCGGSDTAVVSVSGAPVGPITQVTLRHWMRALASSDFRRNVGYPAPQGLVSEPEDRARCAAVARSLQRKAPAGKAALGAAEIGRKCHELYDAVKAQALEYLITVEWTSAEAVELGVRVAPTELRRGFTLSRANLYPTERALRGYLAEHRWTLGDLLFRLRSELLADKVRARLEAKVGGDQAAFVKLALKRSRTLTAKTDCRAGYVVANCKGYHRSSAAASAPNAILEAIAAGRAT